MTIEKNLMNKNKVAVYSFSNKYSISHTIMLAVNAIFLLSGLFMAIFVNDISQCQRASIDNNISQIITNSNVMQPILILLVMASLMLAFSLSYSRIFMSKFISHNVIDDIKNQSMHGIIFPLLYEFLYLFSDDIMKSCSAEIIVLTITFMLIAAFLQVLYTLRETMLDNAIFMHAYSTLKAERTDKIINMLQSIYDHQKEEQSK